MAHSDSLFSRTFRGFSPEEVVAYIDELNRSVKSTNEQNNARIAKLSAELDSLKEADGQIAVLRDTLSEKEAQIAAQQEEIERLTNDAENGRLALAASGEKLVENEECIKQLKAELEASAIKMAAMQENAKEYEALCADVDGVLASARREAQTLLADASAKADEMLRAAEKKAREQSEKLLAETDEKLSENMKKVKYLYRRQDELSEIFKEHKAKVDSFFASLPTNPGENK